jgi:hypothetical protein
MSHRPAPATQRDRATQRRRTSGALDWPFNCSTALISSWFEPLGFSERQAKVIFGDISPPRPRPRCPRRWPAHRSSPGPRAGDHPYAGQRLGPATEAIIGAPADDRRERHGQDSTDPFEQRIGYFFG